MKTNILIYEDTPKYDLWLKLILGGVLALTFILGIIFIYQDTGAAVAMFGITLFDALLFKAILPRRYQIFEDRLRILMGGPFAIDISFSNIEEAKPASGRKAFAYGGLRLATSTHHVVEIVRKKGLNLVISPSNEMFLEQLNQARHMIVNPN
jgi:hypothetical protein